RPTVRSPSAVVDRGRRGARAGPARRRRGMEAPDSGGGAPRPRGAGHLPRGQHPLRPLPPPGAGGGLPVPARGGPRAPRPPTPGSAELTPLGLPNACVLGVSRGGELALSLKPRTYVRDECQGTLARALGTGSTPRELMERVTYADWAPSGQLAVVYGASGEK